MKEAIKNLDGKSMAMIITSAGGIVIALVLIYYTFSRPDSANGIVLEKLNNFQQDFTAYKTDDISTKKEYTNALIQFSKVVEGNTKVMEQVLRQR